MTSPKNPIMLITGGLGAGKTTLLRRILDSTPFRIAVLMNEFGELAIDSKVISGQNIDIIEIAGGCVCCSMTGEFEAAVREIIDTIGPDFIVVEATGVAESDSLVFEVEDNLPEVRLDSVVCIVDAYLGVKYPYIGYTSRTQIASADIVLINKVDLIAPHEAEDVETYVRKYNDRAKLIRTINCALDINLLFGQPSRERMDSLSFPSATKYFSFVWTTDAALVRSKFDLMIDRLPEELYRAKGFVRFGEGGRLFNYVVGRADYEQFDVKRTELVFIGPDLERFRPEIEKMLTECKVQAG